MDIRCPACNKANQTEHLCSRCGCDLTRLHETAGAAAATLRRAREALHAADWEETLAWARKSWTLRHTTEAARLACLAAAALGHTAPALRWHQAAGPS